MKYEIRELSCGQSSRDSEIFLKTLEMNELASFYETGRYQKKNLRVPTDSSMKRSRSDKIILRGYLRQSSNTFFPRISLGP